MTPNEISQVEKHYRNLTNEEISVTLRIGEARKIVDVICNSYKGKEGVWDEFNDAIKRQQARFRKRKEENIKMPYEDKIDDSFRGWVCFFISEGYFDKKLKGSFLNVYSDVSEWMHGNEGEAKLLISYIGFINHILEWLFDKHNAKIDLVEVIVARSQFTPTQNSGTTRINKEFIHHIKSNFKFNKIDFYTSKLYENCQWLGVINNLDIPRKELKELKQAVIESYEKHRVLKVSAIIHGKGGSGKSTLLRRLAIELSDLPYETLWVNESGFDLFVKKGLFLIKESRSKFIILIEDWYRITNRSSINTKNFFSEITTISNIRIVIGDRQVNSLHAQNLNNQENIFLLDNEENSLILSGIENKLPKWKRNIVQLLEGSLTKSAPIFLLLFILSKIAEEQELEKDIDLSEPYTAFQRIISKDIEIIFKTYPWIARMLFIYANIYKEDKFFISYSFFLKLIGAYRADDKIQSLFFNLTDGNSEIHERLRIYINVSKIDHEEDNTKIYLRFNHDILADLGISKINRFIPELGQFDDIKKISLLEKLLIVKDEINSTLQIIKYLLKFQSNIFEKEEICLKYLSQLLNKASLDIYLLKILYENNFPESLIVKTFSILVNEKKLPYHFSRSVLVRYPKCANYLVKQNNFHEYNLKTVITEIRFCEHKYINYNHFLVFIRENYPTKIKKRELIIVLDVLPTYFTENLINDGVVSFSLLKSLNSTKWNELLKSNIDLEFKLVIFKSILENSTCMPKEKHEVFISEALVSTIGLHPFPEKLDEIIFSFFESTIININHGNNINLLIKLFSIELNHIPSWINMMNKCLKHWEVYDREIINILLKNYSVISYDLENICTEILVSWEREVMHTKKSSNTQYFVIALSHPNLRSLALSTSIEIYSSPSLQLKNKELKIIVDKIVEQNEYPEWNLDKV